MTAFGPSTISGKVRALASRLRRTVAASSASPVNRDVSVQPQKRSAETLDLSAHDVVANPFPFYEQLRLSGPVHFLPRNNCWLIIGFDEVYSALNQPNVFSSRVPDWSAVDDVILASDPPEHTPVRRIVAQWFSTLASPEQSAFAERTASKLLQPLSSGEKVDVFRDFSVPLSEEVAAHMIGFDQATLAEMRAAQHETTDLSDWLGKLDSVIQGAAGKIPAYAQLLREAQNTLDEKQVRSLVRFLWIAATTTTRRAIASSVLMLLRYPSVRSRVNSDLALLPAFVEESLRLHPPEHSLSRVAAQPVKLSGKEIPAGALVKLCIAAANRDPARFDQPNELLLDRTPNRQLSFGGGISQVRRSCNSTHRNDRCCKRAAADGPGVSFGAACRVARLRRIYHRHRNALD